MLRIPALKLASFAAVSTVAFLGACASSGGGRAASTTPSAAPQQQAMTTPQPEAAVPTAPAQTTPAPSAAQNSFTDAQLQSFVTASRQIEPLNRQVATATPEQRSALATQIRGILTQNNLDGATYNAIATRAQTDQALASRIAALQGNPNG